MGDQARSPKTGTIGHFEIAARDARKLKAFLESVFGWKITDDGSEVLPISGEDAGINGHILGWPHEGHPTYLTFYVKVDNIQATLDKVTRAGGTVIVPETEIPGGGGRFAQFTDPEGHILGVYAEP